VQVNYGRFWLGWWLAGWFWFGFVPPIRQGGLLDVRSRSGLRAAPALAALLDFVNAI
jgi:hypothetical protein